MITGSSFPQLEKEYKVVIQNIVNTFSFLSNGVFDKNDLKQEALLALYRASCKNSARPYIIKSIVNAVWQAANKFPAKACVLKESDDFVGSIYEEYSSLNLDGLPVKARKIISMMMGGASQKEILNKLRIKKQTYNKILANARKKLIGD